MKRTIKEMEAASQHLLAQHKKILESKVNFNIAQFMFLYNKNIRSEWLLTLLNEICADIDKLDELPDRLIDIAGFKDCIVAIILNKEFAISFREKVLNIVQIAIKKLQTSDCEQSYSKFIEYVFLNVGLENKEFIDALKKEKTIIDKVDICLKTLKAEQKRNSKIAELLKKVIRVDEMMTKDMVTNLKNAKNHISLCFIEIIELLSKNKIITMQLLDAKFVQILIKQILPEKIDIHRAVAFSMLNELYNIYPLGGISNKEFVATLNNVLQADRILEFSTKRLQDAIKQDVTNIKSMNDISLLFAKIINQEDQRLEVEKLATEIVDLLVLREGKNMPNVVESFLKKYMKTKYINKKKCAIAIKLVIKLFHKDLFCKSSMKLLKDFYENNLDSAALISPEIFNVIDKYNKLQSEDKENQVLNTNKSAQDMSGYKLPTPPSIGFIY